MSRDTLLQPPAGQQVTAFCDISPDITSTNFNVDLATNDMKGIVSITAHIPGMSAAQSQSNK